MIIHKIIEEKLTKMNSQLEQLSHNIIATKGYIVACEEILKELSLDESEIPSKKA